MDRATRIEKNRLEEEVIEKHLVKQKKNLAGQLERRMIEHGVGTKNAKDDNTKTIIFKNREGKPIKIAFDPNAIELVNMEAEEDRDKNALKILMARYQKLLHNLF
jgi:hypothetical protein